MKGRRHILLAMSFYHPQLHEGVSKYAAEHGWHLNAKMTTRKEPLWGWQGDGAILQGPISENYNSFVQSLNVPKVSMGGFKGWNCPIVDDDHDAIGRMAADYFYTKGVRNFAVYCEYGKSLAKTQQAFIKAIEKVGCNCEILAITKGNTDWQSQSEDLAEKLQRISKPLAVFCDRDHAGLEVINTCLANNISVPGEVAVLGKHNNPIICEASAIPLSSIDNDLIGMGYRAAELLDMILCGKEVPEKTVISPKDIVTRQSTEILAIKHEKVRRALIFIQNNFISAISLTEIADQCGMSVRGLQESFHREIGHAVNEEIIRLRIKRAKELLIMTDRTVEVVALEAGFKSLRNFHNLFKKSSGFTPGAFRKKHRKL